MKIIPLRGKRGKGKLALVDDEDYEYLSKFSWYMDENGYACTKRRTPIYDGKSFWKMHRLVLRISDPNIFVDHIFHDTLDNRKEKLRTCTRSENQRNMKMHKDNSSKFKGTYLDSRNGNFLMKIGNSSSEKHVTMSFKDKITCASAYNYFATQYFGEFAELNEGVPIISLNDINRLRLINKGGHK